MLTQTTNLNPADPGLVVLVTLLRFNGIGADPEQIRHRFGGSPVGIAEMLRLGKELGLKARATKSAWPRLANTPLPAIAALKDGGFLFLAKAGEDKVLVQSPSSPRPSLMTTRRASRSTARRCRSTITSSISAWAWR
jgi:subfamily B ATP-binding cassette protein HlyB/CyaB